MTTVAAHPGHLPEPRPCSSGSPAADRHPARARRTPVRVHADAPVTGAGVTALLRPRPEVMVVPDGEDPVDPWVGVAVVEDLDEATLRAVRRLRAVGAAGVVLVTAAPNATEVTTAVAAGVTAIIRRRQATADRLVDAIAATAAGDADLPADLLRGLLDHTRDLHHTVLQPAGRTPTGCTPRQIQILHLIAAGHTTEQIATRLHQSQRTVKNDLAAYASRYQLRNRAHAVAHAIRAGII